MIREHCVCGPYRMLFFGDVTWSRYDTLGIEGVPTKVVWRQLYYVYNNTVNGFLGWKDHVITLNYGDKHARTLFLDLHENYPSHMFT